jgi:alpha-glucuronidase
MEVVEERRYEEIMEKLKESKKRHKYWSDQYVEFCYARYQAKKEEK